MSRLHRLLQLGLVEEREIPIGGERRAQAFQLTGAGERCLHQWVEAGGTDEAVVTRNPMLLRVFLGRGHPVPEVLKLVDARLRQAEAELGDVLWGRRRADEMGLTPHPDRKFSAAVSDYVIRQLYFEQANLRQLRDTIAASTRPRSPGTTSVPVRNRRCARAAGHYPEIRTSARSAEQCLSSERIPASPAGR